MNASTQNSRKNFFAHPALRTLLDFDVSNGRRIADIRAANRSFIVYHDRATDSYLVHYRSKSGHPGQESPQGYVRCGSFMEMLEALAEEIPMTLTQHGLQTPEILPLSARWLQGEPQRIDEDYRTRFILALSRLRKLHLSPSQGKVVENRTERWMQALRPYALSA